MKHIATPSKLVPGDVLSDGRVIAAVTRNFNNLSSYLIRFTDGTHTHAYEFSVWNLRTA